MSEQTEPVIPVGKITVEKLNLAKKAGGNGNVKAICDVLIGQVRIFGVKVVAKKDGSGNFIGLPAKPSARKWSEKSSDYEEIVFLLPEARAKVQEAVLAEYETKLKTEAGDQTKEVAHAYV